jgi:hypothetical protein
MPHLNSLDYTENSREDPGQLGAAAIAFRPGQIVIPDGISLPADE